MSGSAVTIAGLPISGAATLSDMLHVQRAGTVPADVRMTLADIVGLIGRAAPSTFLFQQVLPTGTWVVDHRLGRFPSVVVTDSAGSVVFGDVRHDTVNQLTITFAAAFAGSASLN